MAKKYLLIDGNAIGYAAHNMTKLTNGGREVQAIFGMTKSIRNLRQAFPNAEILVLWDGRAQWRYDLHPGYKDRDSDPESKKRREAYKEQRPAICKMLKLAGIKQMTAATHEADDMAGYFVNALSDDPDNDILLVTGDTDWHQLVRPNVAWYDPRKDGKWVTFKTFTDKTGYRNPFTALEGKALQGDTSDKIPGVGGIGEKGAPEFLAEFGSVYDFFRKVDSGEITPKKKAHINLAKPEGRAVFARNMRLMSLQDVEKPAPEAVTVVRGEFDEAGFKRFCEDYAFHSLLRDFSTFTKPFRKE